MKGSYCLQSTRDLPLVSVGNLYKKLDELWSNLAKLEAPCHPFSLSNGKTRSLQRLGPMLLPLHLSQPTTAPFLSSACSTTKQPPGSSMNPTLPLSTTLMFKTSFKSDLTMSRRLLKRAITQRARYRLGVSLVLIHPRHGCREFSSCHLHAPPLFLLLALVHAKNTYLGPVPVISPQHDIA